MPLRSRAVFTIYNMEHDNVLLYPAYLVNVLLIYCWKQIYCFYLYRDPKCVAEILDAYLCDETGAQLIALPLYNTFTIVNWRIHQAKCGKSLPLSFKNKFYSLFTENISPLLIFLYRLSNV